MNILKYYFDIDLAKAKPSACNSPIYLYCGYISSCWTTKHNWKNL